MVPQKLDSFARRKKNGREILNHRIYVKMWGHAVEQLVEALRYKPEIRGFDSR
jgi:hypothetical protein